MIEIRNISKIYRTGFWKKKFVALNNINLNIDKASIHGLVGSNGAGKTTLIKIVTGITQMSSGSIKIFGEDISSTYSKRHIGFMPETPYTYDFLTGKEYLLMMGKLSGLSANECYEKIPKLLSSVALDKKNAENKEIKKYSKGMKTRISLCQALIHNPPFIVLDEPMSGLDPKGRHEFKQIIKALHDDGKTIFFSSHVLDDVKELCTHVQIIEKGSLKWFGTTNDLFNSSKSITEIEDIIYGQD